MKGFFVFEIVVYVTRLRTYSLLPIQTSFNIGRNVEPIRIINKLENVSQIKFKLDNYKLNIV